MQKSFTSFINKSIRALALKGSGWQRRPSTDGLEWRDPLTGLWYREKTAMRLMKAYAIAPYDRNARRPF